MYIYIYIYPTTKYNTLLDTGVLINFVMQIWKEIAHEIYIYIQKVLVTKESMYIMKFVEKVSYDNN